MTFAEIMAWLSTNTIIGMPVACVVILLSYLLTSIPIYIKCQRKGYDVSFGAFMPIIHWYFFIRSLFKPAIDQPSAIPAVDHSDVVPNEYFEV